MKYVGFVGYSDKKFDENKAEEIILSIFENLNSNDVIVAGATNVGINKLVYKEAKNRGMQTVGVMCKKGYDYELFNVDSLIVHGDDWGEESKEFLSMINSLYRIGGGKQSLKEVEMAKKMNIKVFEYELEEIT